MTDPAGEPSTPGHSSASSLGGAGWSPPLAPPDSSGSLGTSATDPSPTPAPAQTDVSAAPSSRTSEPARKAGRALVGILETLLATLVVFILLQTFVGRTYAVEQTSMETTLEPGQPVIVDMLTPHFDPYKRGDIVVFTPPADVQLGEPLIKRVIAVAGDTVDIRDGRVIVNGQALTEPYVFGDQPTYPQTDVDHWVIPPGDLFVLGDHREVSRDSRSFGPIPLSSVVGRAWLRFYPLTDLRILSTGGCNRASCSGTGLA